MKKLLLIIVTFVLGVNSHAQWNRTSGPEGISISSFTVINDTIYAGTETDGVFASTDDGISWFPVNSGIETQSISVLKSVPGYLFAATFGNGIYRSTNGGQTWLPPASGGNLFVTDLTIKDAYIFAGTGSDGVYRSTDNGENWTQLFGIYGILSMGTSNDRVFASASNYTFATTDYGVNWFEVTSLSGSSVWCYYFDGNLLLAGGVNEIYRSTDQGVTFTTIPVTFSFGIVNIYSITKLGSDYYMGTSYDGVYKSTDNGSTWAAANEGMGPKDIRSVVPTGSGSLIAGSHYVGVFRSTNMGSMWSKSMSGLPAGSSIPEMLATESAVFAGTRDGIYRSTDNGNTWVELQGDNDTINYSLVRGLCELNGNIYAATHLQFHTTVYKSTDNGSTWTRSGNGLPADLTFIDGLTASGSNLVAGTSEGIFYSSDQGSTWYQANAPVQFIEDIAASGNYVYAIVSGTGIYRSFNNGVSWSIALPSTVDYVCLAAYDNYVYAGSFFSGLRYSSNFGTGWYSSAGFQNEESIFAIGPAGDGTVLAATYADPTWIYASYDYGGYFTPYSEGLGPWAIAQSFAINDTYMFAGTAYNGIWRRLRPGVPVELVSFSAKVSGNNVELHWETATETNNSGFQIERWKKKTKGSNPEWNNIGFVKGFGTTTQSQTYSFTDKENLSGTYEYRLKQIDLDGSFKYSNVVEIEVDIPLKFSLNQNYPNPFNPSTKISYSINEKGYVSLIVYDVLGSKISTLVDKEQSPGNYEVIFNAEDLTSGVYIYELKAGQYTDIKKMLLLK